MGAEEWAKFQYQRNLLLIKLKVFQSVINRKCRTEVGAMEG